VFRSNHTQLGVEIEISPGKEYFVRVEIATGFLKGHGRLVATTPEQGGYEIKRLKLLDPDKVRDQSRVLINGIGRDTSTETRTEGVWLIHNQTIQHPSEQKAEGGGKVCQKADWNNGPIKVKTPKGKCKYAVESGATKQK
jgi:hypothetical protein